VNPVRLTRYNVVTQAQLDMLRTIRNDAYAHRTEVPNAVPPLPASEPADRLNLFGTWFKAGTTPGGLSYAMNGDDLRAILRSIRNGKEQAGFAIATIHTHEDTTSLVMPFLSEHPADFLVELAHKAIDSGADMFVGTGIHALRSIEIYKGKPIFYGLAQFVYQLNQGVVGLERYMRQGLNPFTTEKTDAELSWEAWADPSQTRMGQDNMESVIAECRYAGGTLVEVRLHPIDLGDNAPLSEKGIPRVATPETAQRILRRLQRISKPYGTTISIQGNVGVIVPTLAAGR
jgi:capsule synthesis protein PGA_cap